MCVGSWSSPFHTLADSSATSASVAASIPANFLFRSRPTRASMSARAAAPSDAFFCASFSFHPGPASPCPFFMNGPNLSDLRPPASPPIATHTIFSTSSGIIFFFTGILRTYRMNSSCVIRPEPSASIEPKILNHSFCSFGDSFSLSSRESPVTVSSSAALKPPFGSGAVPFFTAACCAASSAFFFAPALGAPPPPPLPLLSSIAAL